VRSLFFFFVSGVGVSFLLILPYSPDALCLQLHHLLFDFRRHDMTDIFIYCYLHVVLLLHLRRVVSQPAGWDKIRAQIRLLE
jgi:hypothetical protein